VQKLSLEMAVKLLDGQSSRTYCTSAESRSKGDGFVPWTLVFAWGLIAVTVIDTAAI
jgi:hypothetical protein